MANVIEACLRRIYHSIPHDILNVTFRPTRNETLDHQIHEMVIHDRVLFDCNLVAGRIKKIVLQSDWIETASVPSSYMFGSTAGFSIYRIPAEYRESRMISSVIEVLYPYSFSSNLNLPGINSGGMSAGALACQALEAQTFQNSVPLPIPLLVSGHQVKLTPVSLSPIQNLDWVLTCRLNYDVEFTNLNNQGILPLVDLVLLATKAYIFNELALKMDSAMIVAGQPLGKFKDIVEGYSDANNEYLAALRQFNGGATVLDPEHRRQRIKDML